MRTDILENAALPETRLAFTTMTVLKLETVIFNLNKNNMAIIHIKINKLIN